jgi:hypothetical protein
MERKNGFSEAAWSEIMAQNKSHHNNFNSHIFQIHFLHDFRLKNFPIFAALLLYFINLFSRMK